MVRPPDSPDPARYCFALGVKDGYPFPVPLKTYDAAMRILQRALEQARSR